MCDLIIRYQAETDKPTLCNLTNHTYFNLGGHAHGTVKDHVVAIEADVITKVDSHLIPTGDYMPVTDTPLDLRDGLLLEDGLEVMARSMKNTTLVSRYSYMYLLSLSGINLLNRP